jgi:hypothetical protein
VSIAVTEAMRKREIQVYQGLRYDRQNFSALDSQPGVSLVYTNGPFDLYLIEGSGPEGANATALTANRSAG